MVGLTSWGCLGWSQAVPAPSAHTGGEAASGHLVAVGFMVVLQPEAIGSHQPPVPRLESQCLAPALPQVCRVGMGCCRHCLFSHGTSDRA